MGVEKDLAHDNYQLEVLRGLLGDVFYSLALRGRGKKIHP